jgi:MerR family copper efflux transcriptional regulator
MTVARYQIGQVAEALGLSIRTIRHWDEMRVVGPSGRSNGGFRLYTDDDICRLRWVMRLKPMKFTLEEIRELLDLKHRAAAGSLSDEDRSRLQVFALAAEASGRTLREQLAWTDDTAAELRAIAGRPRPDRDSPHGSSGRTEASPRVSAEARISMR